MSNSKRREQYGGILVLIATFLIIGSSITIGLSSFWYQDKFWLTVFILKTFPNYGVKIVISYISFILISFSVGAILLRKSSSEKFPNSRH